MLAICVVESVSKRLDILTGIFNIDGASSIFTWVLADTASAAFPVHPGSHDTMSMTFAAVICDADDPSSAKTAWLHDRLLQCHLGV